MTTAQQRLSRTVEYLSPVRGTKCLVVLTDGNVSRWHRNRMRFKRRLLLKARREDLWDTRKGPLAIIFKLRGDVPPEQVADLPQVQEMEGWRFLTRRYVYPKTDPATEDADSKNADWLKVVASGKFVPTSSMSPEDLFTKLDHRSARELVRLERLIPLLRAQGKTVMWLTIGLIAACVLMFIAKAGGSS